MKSRSVIVLLLLLVFVLLGQFSFVSAQFGSGLDDVVKNLGSSFSEGVNSEGGFFVRFLIFLLVALIVYAVAQQMPFLDSNNLTWVRLLVAAVVAVLATFYLDDTEVAAVLLSYGALGITLSALIPFFVVGAVSKGLNDRGYSLSSKILWIVFGVVLLLRFFAGWASGEIGPFATLVYVLTLVGVGLMVAYEKRLWRSLRRGRIDHNIDAYEDMTRAATARQRVDAGAVNRAANEYAEGH